MRCVSLPFFAASPCGGPKQGVRSRETGCGGTGCEDRASWRVVEMHLSCTKSETFDHGFIKVAGDAASRLLQIQIWIPRCIASLIAPRWSSSRSAQVSSSRVSAKRKSECFHPKELWADLRPKVERGKWRDRPAPSKAVLATVI